MSAGVSFPRFDPWQDPEISTILDGLRMREAYASAVRSKLPADDPWNDFIDVVAGIDAWSDGGQIGKARSQRILCMRVVNVSEAAFGSMASKVSAWLYLSCGCKCPCV